MYTKSFSKQEIIEDLISLFINQKIDKKTLMKILEINKIPFAEFNKEVINKIQHKQKINSMNIDRLIDNEFLTEIFSQRNEKSAEQKRTGIQKLELDSVYKSNKFISYKTSRRILTNDELNVKIKQYGRIMNLEGCDEDVVEYLSRGVATYLKNLVDKCGNEVNKRKIIKALGKDRNILNIFDVI